MTSQFHLSTGWSEILKFEMSQKLLWNMFPCHKLLNSEIHKNLNKKRHFTTFVIESFWWVILFVESPNISDNLLTNWKNGDKIFSEIITFFTKNLIYESFLTKWLSSDLQWVSNRLTVMKLTRKKKGRFPNSRGQFKTRNLIFSR